MSASSNIVYLESRLSLMSKDDRQIKNAVFHHTSTATIFRNIIKYFLGYCPNYKILPNSKKQKEKKKERKKENKQTNKTKKN